MLRSDASVTVGWRITGRAVPHDEQRDTGGRLASSGSKYLLSFRGTVQGNEMLPWAHLAVGYIAYSIWARVWYGRAPAGAPTLALALGTQLPDLVDKPANWWFDVLDGRGFGHSVFTVVPLCLIVLVATRRRNRGELGVAFTIGMGLHLLGDAWKAILEGTVRWEAPYLLWPLLPAPVYEKDSFVDHLREWIATAKSVELHSLGDLLASSFGVQFAVFVLLVGVWAIDGFPGFRLLWYNTVGALRRVVR